MFLRCLQSAGSSGTVALAQGVVADLVTSAERGTYVGLTSIPSIVGPILGPILGGVLAEYGGWPWIFYFLIILSTLYFISFLLFFPETCRKVVGNGSVSPPKLNMCLADVVRTSKRVQANVEGDAAQGRAHGVHRISFPNPLSTLRIAAEKESALILFSSSIVFCCLYAVNVGVPSQFKKNYGFNELQIGLVFIPYGAGGVVSAFTTGKIIDRSWKYHAKQAGFEVVKHKYQDLTNFPIERARLTVALPCLYLSSMMLIAYGWVLYQQTHLGKPISCHSSSSSSKSRYGTL